MIPGLCHKVDDICSVLGNYAAYSGNSLPTFWDNLSVHLLIFIFFTLEDGTDSLSYNIGKELSLYVA